METVIACLTPPGSAAIATLGLCGPRALEVTRSLLTPTLLPETPASHSHWFGQLGVELKDQVVVTVPALDPVPVVEIHCHGGREVVQMMLDTFRERGLRVIDWRDWLRQTNKSLVAAELQIALAETSTLRTTALLLGQVAGILEGELQRAETEPAVARELLRWAPLGLHLTQPWRVVIAGAPNAGKSSLVNAIAGYQRCVVSEIPGTTRDVVTTAVALDGWPVELIDTAGLRMAEGAIEAEGICRALEAIGTADLCLWLLDGSTTPIQPGREWGEVLVVVNKVDQPPAWDWRRLENAVQISATAGSGIAELCQAIASRLVPEVPAPGTAIPICERQAVRLRELTGERH